MNLPLTFISKLFGGTSNMETNDIEKAIANLKSSNLTNKSKIFAELTNHLATINKEELQHKTTNIEHANERKGRRIKWEPLLQEIQEAIVSELTTTTQEQSSKISNHENSSDVFNLWKILCETIFPNLISLQFIEAIYFSKNEFEFDEEELRLIFTIHLQIGIADNSTSFFDGLFKALDKSKDVLTQISTDFITAAIALPKKLLAHFQVKTIIPLMFDKNTGETHRKLLIDIAFGLMPLASLSHLNPNEIEEFKLKLRLDYLKQAQVYCPRPPSGENNQNIDEQWHELCKFVPKYLGSFMHDDVELINSLLRLVESAFRSKNTEYIACAYDCWRELMDNYRLNWEYLSGYRQIRLLIKPLKIKLSRSEKVLCKRFSLWLHLLKSLRNKGDYCVEEFLRFCYSPFHEASGEGAGQIQNPTKLYKTLWPQMTDVLISIFGHFGHDSCKSAVNVVLEQPIITVENFSKCYHVAIASVTECCLLLQEWCELDRRKTIVKCLWSSIFKLISSVDDEEAKNAALNDVFHQLKYVIQKAPENYEYMEYFIIHVSETLTDLNANFIFNKLLLDTLILPMMLTIINTNNLSLKDEHKSAISDLLSLLLNFKPNSLDPEDNEDDPSSYSSNLILHFKYFTKLFNCFFKKDLSFYNAFKSNELSILIWLKLAEYLKGFLLTQKDNIELQDKEKNEEENKKLWQMFVLFPFEYPTTKLLNYATWTEVSNLIFIFNLTDKSLIIGVLKDIAKNLKNCSYDAGKVIKFAATVIDKLIPENIDDETSKEIVHEILSIVLSCGKLPLVGISNTDKDDSLAKIFNNCISVVKTSALNFEKEISEGFELFIVNKKLYFLMKTLENALAVNKFVDRHKLITKNLSEHITALSCNNSSELSAVKTEALAICSLLESKQQATSLNANANLNTNSPSSVVNKNSKTPLSRAAKIANMVNTPSSKAAIGTLSPISLFGKSISDPSTPSTKTSSTSSILYDGKNTPKSANKKFGTPRSSAKKSAFNIDDDDSGKYVLIDTKVTFDPAKLTEHQKEVTCRRRDDIPALYNDLSQSQSNLTTQSTQSTSNCAQDLINKASAQTQESSSASVDIMNNKSSQHRRSDRWNKIVNAMKVISPKCDNNEKNADNKIMDERSNDGIQPFTSSENTPQTSPNKINKSSPSSSSAASDKDKEPCIDEFITSLKRRKNVIINIRSGIERNEINLPDDVGKVMTEHYLNLSEQKAKEKEQQQQDQEEKMETDTEINTELIESSESSPKTTTKGQQQEITRTVEETKEYGVIENCENEEKVKNNDDNLISLPLHKEVDENNESKSFESEKTDNETQQSEEENEETMCDITAADLSALEATENTPMKREKSEDIENKPNNGNLNDTNSTEKNTTKRLSRLDNELKKLSMDIVGGNSFVQQARLKKRRSCINNTSIKDKETPNAKDKAKQKTTQQNAKSKSANKNKTPPTPTTPSSRVKEVAKGSPIKTNSNTKKSPQTQQNQQAKNEKNESDDLNQSHTKEKRKIAAIVPEKQEKEQEIVISDNKTTRSNKRQSSLNKETSSEKEDNKKYPTRKAKDKENENNDGKEKEEKQKQEVRTSTRTTTANKTTTATKKEDAKAVNLQQQTNLHQPVRSSKRLANEEDKAKINEKQEVADKTTITTGGRSTRQTKINEQVNVTQIKSKGGKSKDVKVDEENKPQKQKQEQDKDNNSQQKVNNNKAANKSALVDKNVEEEIVIEESIILSSQITTTTQTKENYSVDDVEEDDDATICNTQETPEKEKTRQSTSNKLNITVTATNNKNKDNTERRIAKPTLRSLRNNLKQKLDADKAQVENEDEKTQKLKNEKTQNVKEKTQNGKEKTQNLKEKTQNVKEKTQKDKTEKSQNVNEKTSKDKNEKTQKDNNEKTQKVKKDDNKIEKTQKDKIEKTQKDDNKNEKTKIDDKNEIIAKKRASSTSLSPSSLTNNLNTLENVDENVASTPSGGRKRRGRSKKSSLDGTQQEQQQQQETQDVNVKNENKTLPQTKQKGQKRKLNDKHIESEGQNKDTLAVENENPQNNNVKEQDDEKEEEGPKSKRIKVDDSILPKEEVNKIKEDDDNDDIKESQDDDQVVIMETEIKEPETEIKKPETETETENFEDSQDIIESSQQPQDTALNKIPTIVKLRKSTTTNIIDVALKISEEIGCSSFQFTNAEADDELEEETNKFNIHQTQEQQNKHKEKAKEFNTSTSKNEEDTQNLLLQETLSVNLESEPIEKQEIQKSLCEIETESIRLDNISTDTIDNLQININSLRKAAEEKESPSSQSSSFKREEAEETPTKKFKRTFGTSSNLESEEEDCSSEKILDAVKSKNKILPTSPITFDTPNRNSEFMTNTYDISPIKSDDGGETMSLAPINLFAVKENSDNLTQANTTKIPDLIPIALKSSINNEIKKDKAFINKAASPLSSRSARLLNLLPNAPQVLNSNLANKQGTKQTSGNSSSNNVGVITKTVVTNTKSPLINLKQTDRIKKMMLLASENEQEQEQTTNFGLLAVSNGITTGIGGGGEGENVNNHVIDEKDVLLFKREIPKSTDTPKSGILKRKLPDTFDEGISPAAKHKRVNFCDPPTSCKKVFFTDPEEHTPVKIRKRFSFSNNNKNNDATILSAKELGLDLLIDDENEQKCDNQNDEILYPPLIGCAEKLSPIVKQFGLIVQDELQSNHIFTVGQLAALKESELNKFSIKEPKASILRDALKEYKLKMDCNEKNSEIENLKTSLNNQAGLPDDQFLSLLVQNIPKHIMTILIDHHQANQNTNNG